MFKEISLSTLILFCSFTFAYADFIHPGSKERCHVCGMAVSKNPGWVAQIIFIDGTHASFDGPKDMFRYYLDMSKYNKRNERDDVAEMYVTGYFSRSPIDAFKTFYVVHSHVHGPMGNDLVPFYGRNSAEKFAEARGGKVVSFEEVRKELIKKLDRGQHGH